MLRPELVDETLTDHETIYSHQPKVELPDRPRAEQAEKQRVFYDKSHEEICAGIDAISPDEIEAIHDLKNALKDKLENVIFEIKAGNSLERPSIRVQAIQAFHEIKNKFCTDHGFSTDSPEYLKLNILIAEDINSYLQGLATDLAIVEAQRHCDAINSEQKKN